MLFEQYSNISILKINSAVVVLQIVENIFVFHKINIVLLRTKIKIVFRVHISKQIVEQLVYKDISLNFANCGNKACLFTSRGKQVFKNKIN